MLPAFTSEAKIELAEIVTFLVEQAGVAVARKVIGSIKSGCAFLNQTPGAGHVREDLTDKAVRFWPIYSYLVVYDPIPQPIRILRVLHGSRDVATIVDELPN
ncbi:MAG TPA: type II toxin-antitoxin system RelE/ParE family toxin [Capsulimonadaceae bacterium]